MRHQTAIISYFLIAFFSTVAIAGQNDKDPRHKNRIENQNKRIRKGFKSGELTYKEAAQLRKQQRKVRAAIKEANSDGVVTKEEKFKVEAMQDVASARIYLQKHDGQDAPEKSRAHLRQLNQRGRVQNGVESGKISAEEGEFLNSYISHNAKVLKKMNSDGVITKQEAGRIEAMQDIGSVKILLQGKDANDRAPAAVK